ncbi:MAG: Dna2/Cas4 domain-containing protein [Candidatus Levybacteria bacterium]|nr:Dna2/Cas4 domain-containing protein [Candidatus Levybacteria bacterium]
MILLFLAISTLCIGIIFVFYLLRKKKSFGVLLGKRIYQDTEENPGKLLFAKTIPLCGKPDYLLQQNQMIFPVEVKTGRTPTSPYLNHEMQLMAYCLLVEENYHTRPMGGYIRYPDKEFKILYTKEAEDSLRNIIAEMIEKKQNGEELFCKHPEHI